MGTAAASSNDTLAGFGTSRTSRAGAYSATTHPRPEDLTALNSLMSRRRPPPPREVGAT